MLKKINKSNRDEFNYNAVHPLQTWEWGEFRKETGNEILRLATFNNGSLTKSMQLTIHSIPGISPLKIAALIRGPKPDKETLDALAKIANNRGFIFTKLEPNVAFGDTDLEHLVSSKEKDKLVSVLKQTGCVQGKTLFTPSSFWIDLTKDSDKMMKDFHSKTRYNIRYAKRKGVSVQEDNSDEAFEKYIQLTKRTVERQEFYAHSEKYHRLMWKALHTDMVKAGNKPIAHLLTAKYKGKILTTWILFAWKDFLYYPYGASSMKYKNVQANNLMMWEAILFGKRKGLKTFDLWGREPGKGFTRFKEGYNPQIVEFLGTWDMITSPLYYPYRVAEMFRWGLLRLRAKLGVTKPKF